MTNWLIERFVIYTSVAAIVGVLFLLGTAIYALMTMPD